MNKNLFKLSALIILALFAPLAGAHPGHIDGGVLSGFTHPFMGIDHLLAILAVGIWAGKAGGYARWQVPAVYMLAMTFATIAFIGSAGFPMIENGIAVSVLLLGLLIAFAVRLPVIAVVILVGSFAFFHGAAHGVEMIATVSPLTYVSGLLVATAVLQAVGVVIGSVSKADMSAQAVRLAGAIIAGSGGYMLLAN